MSRKLISMFRLSLVSAVLIIALLVGVYLSLALGNISDHHETEAALMLEKTVQDINTEIDAILENANVLANYGDTVGSFMEGNRFKRMDMRDSVKFVLGMQLVLNRGMEYICVCSRDGSTMFIIADETEAASNMASFKVADRVMREYDLTQPRRGVTFTKCYSEMDYTYFAVLAPVYQSAGSRYLGCLVLLYRGDSLRDLLPDSGHDGTVLLCESIPLASVGREILPEKEDGQILTARTKMSGWQVSLRIVERYTAAELRTVIQQCVLVFICTAAALVLLVVIQYHKIVGPVLMISEQVSRIGQEPGTELKLESGVKEYDELIRSINAMLAEEQKTNEEMLRIRTTAYEEQISFLQAQINPHFLYNCLESIRGMAGQDNLKDVRGMMSGMSAIYRFCSRRDSFATVREELECAENYAYVMRLCYMQSYGFEIRAEEEALDKAVPRMILQPLIENAVRHGFRAAGLENGNVWVSVSVEDDLLRLTVENDGEALPEETLREWNSGWDWWRENEGNRIGLTNVMKRLGLLYGNRARACFEKRENRRGLKVTFLLPAEAPRMEEKGK